MGWRTTFNGLSFALRRGDHGKLVVFAWWPDPRDAETPTTPPMLWVDAKSPRWSGDSTQLSPPAIGGSTATLRRAGLKR